MINRLSNVTSLILMRGTSLSLSLSPVFHYTISDFKRNGEVSFEYALSPSPDNILSMVYYSRATITQSSIRVLSRLFPTLSLLCPVLLILLLQQLSILLLIRPQPRRVRIQRRIVIRLSQQTLNGQQNRPHVIRRRPLLFQNIQTNIPKLIDVWVETRGGKFHHRRFKRVLVRER